MARKKTHTPLQHSTALIFRELFLFFYQMLAHVYLATVGPAIKKNVRKKKRRATMNNRESVIEPLISAMEEEINRVREKSPPIENSTDREILSSKSAECSENVPLPPVPLIANSTLRLFQETNAAVLEKESDSPSQPQKDVIIDDSCLSVLSDLTMSSFDDSSTPSPVTVSSTASITSSLNRHAAEFYPNTPSPIAVSRFTRQEVYQQPPCYRNHRLSRNIINQLSEHFAHSDCEGYIFGSTNYKKNELPHDFDIVIENIKTNEARLAFDALLAGLQRTGGVVMTSPDGSIGYKKANRFVVPMVWNGFKIDFIVSEDNIIEHSKKMDFTVGAMYFNLRQKKMYHIKPLTSLVDLNAKRLQTIGDPLDSFTTDLSRIFRGIRLIASEGFHFSQECQHAINTLFSGHNNPFNQMNTGKLFQQLNLLFSSNYAAYNINILFQMGLLDKLRSRLMQLTHCGSSIYLELLQSPNIDYMQQTHSPDVDHSDGMRPF